MSKEKRVHPKVKSNLHPRNRHRARYDFKSLIQTCSDLAPFVIVNQYNDESVDFFNPAAVKMLNKALLMHFYDIEYWDIPEQNLCPPIPGRADYIHHIADLLYRNNPKLLQKAIQNGHPIQCLDVGVGANCVYPIIGVKEYGWQFVGSEIDVNAADSARRIVDQNANLKGKIEIRNQERESYIFKGIIRPNEKFHLTVCNPPFHASAAEAKAASTRKLRNLKGKKSTNHVLNFGGVNRELWCEVPSSSHSQSELTIP